MESSVAVNQLAILQLLNGEVTGTECERMSRLDSEEKEELRNLKEEVATLRQTQATLRVNMNVSDNKIYQNQDLIEDLRQKYVQLEGIRQKSVSEEGAVGGAVVAGRDEDEPATEGMVVNTQLAGAWSPSLARTSGYRQQSPAALSVRPNPLMKTRSSTKK
ncbi:hypothetical protein Pmani_010797 [Petrolisthes manimaculis]|uniref:Uncharacterized protein n=1 Tax=Petrolisthes manimaculis TaxID=1843537 RepID=A0AAE1Q0U5_9EUCA|nr:hypothetical protein Pmani_010797 [Petrolisthes manimaculis]